METQRRIRRSRSVPIPTGRLALALVVAAVALAVGRADRWLLVGVVLAVVVVAAAFDFFLATNPSMIGVEREFPTSITLGDEAQLRWLVKNHSTRRVRLSVADALWPSLEATRRSSTFVVAAQRQHRFGATITPQRRGRFPFGAVTIRVSGPVGLVGRQQTRTIPDTLAVLPAFPSRDRIFKRMRIPLESGLRSVRTRGSGTDFDQLREYRPGDDIRRVDWAATARLQKAIVREYRAERNQHVIALLDNGRIMAGTVAGAPRVEHAMDAVLGLTQVATAFGDNVGLVTFDDQVRAIVPVSSRKSQFARMTEAMYLLDPRYDESAYRTAFTTASTRFRRRSLFVVFTDLVESVVTDSLLPSLAALTRTHLVMVAAVRDPDAVRWAASAPTDGVEDAYRAAAAVAALNGRDRAVARLTAAGVVVVDAQPGDLAVDVVDRYLELKARGRL